MGKQTKRAQRASRWDGLGGDPWAKGPAELSPGGIELSTRIAEKSVTLAREELETARGPTVNEMACIRKVAEERMRRVRKEMRRRGALAAKQAADRVWKNRGAEARPLVHPPATTYPVSGRWELWEGATAAEVAEAKRILKAHDIRETPLARLEIRVDEPPPPPLPPAPEGWKPVEWLNTEHVKKFAFGPHAGSKLHAQLQAFKGEGEGTSTAPPPPSPDTEKKRLGTALYKRIVARVPTTTCPEDKVLQVGLRVHKMVMQKDVHDMKNMMRKNTEAFDMELEYMIAGVLATDKLLEKPPDKPTMNDDNPVSDEVPFRTGICRTRATHFLSDACAPPPAAGVGGIHGVQPPVVGHAPFRHVPISWLHLGSWQRD